MQNKAELLEQKNYYIALYEIYSSLLTEKQKTSFEYYYFEDYSLAEIADELKVSRNAIFDTIKKVINNLEHLEQCLKIYKKETRISEILDEASSSNNEEVLNLIKKINDWE